ncbi:unnamed protein product, partial [Amoebophrya sp. A25]
AGHVCNNWPSRNSIPRAGAWWYMDFPDALWLIDDVATQINVIADGNYCAYHSRTGRKVKYTCPISSNTGGGASSLAEAGADKEKSSSTSTVQQGT